MNPPTSAAKAGGARLDFVDALRGAAVVFMIMWHTVDHWLRPELETGNGYAVARLLGGMAAPLFLFLAGASLAFKAAGATRKQAPRWETLRDMVARGIEVIVLGYALRLQFWAIDASGLIRTGGWRVLIPAIAGIVCALVGVEKLAKQPWRALALFAAAVALYALAVHQIGIVHPEKQAALLRVDVLQCIGMSLVVVAIACTFAGAFTRTWIAVLLGIAVGIATQWVWSAMPGPLPDGVAGYLGRWVMPDGRTTSATLFPLFPWMSYTFLGVAVGAAWDRSVRAGRVWDTVIALGAIGALLALLTQEPLPLAVDVHRAAPWIVQPWRVAYRVGLALIFAAVALALTPSHEKWGAPLRTFGRTSMLVYWVHLEFAFGIAAKPVKASLDWVLWLLLFLVLTAAMYALARFRLGPWKKTVWPRVVRMLSRTRPSS